MFSRFFIERPIFAAVIAILIVIAGGVAMSVLPVQQYPTITPVQVTVQANYPGADSSTVAESVAAPIEAQVNGVDMSDANRLAEIDAQYVRTQSLMADFRLILATLRGEGVGVDRIVHSNK